MQSPLDRALMQATQTGLPLTPTPYADLANTLGVSEAEVMARLRTMHADGRLQAVGRLPGTIAHPANELADLAGRPQRHRHAGRPQPRRVVAARPGSPLVTTASVQRALDEEGAV